MGNFFASPQQRAGQSLYDAAVSGHPVGEGGLKKSYALDLQNLRSGTKQESATLSGDILSRITSQGGTPGAATEGVIGKQNEQLFGQEQGGENALYSDLMKNIMGLTSHDISTGLATMSNSSTFGDILGGLSTLTNIGGGLTKLIMALNGNQGAINNLGGRSFSGSGNNSDNLA